jgi:hypothetical protein
MYYKNKVANWSLVILVLIFAFGIFQAWNKSRNPFAFYIKNKNMIKKSNYLSNNFAELNNKNDSTFITYFRK